MYYDEKLVDQYLNALEKEIKEVYKENLLNTIYIGGGTPSSLNVKQLTKLFKMINNLKKEKTIEYTIECNFDSIDKDKIDLFIEYGINRISFGLESINKDNLKYLERTLDINHAVDMINYCKSKGLNNINIDLIYALKDETIEILKEDLDFIMKLDVPHISTYSLILEENTKLFIRKEKNIDDDIDFEMYQFICNYCKEHDFHHYEISNFAKSGYESKHNLVYWNNEEYYGFGLGSASFIGNKRINNTRSINKYLKGTYCYNFENLTKYDKISYEIILNLRLDHGICKKTFYDKYKVSIQEVFDYKDLMDKGLLSETDDNVFIKEEHFYLLNEIILRFLEGEACEREIF